MRENDFGAARELLERAQAQLRGTDETTCEMRQALDLLIEAALAAEYRSGTATVIPFPRQDACR